MVVTHSLLLILVSTFLIHVYRWSFCHIIYIYTGT